MCDEGCEVCMEDDNYVDDDVDDESPFDDSRLFGKMFGALRTSQLAQLKAMTTPRLGQLQERY